MINKYFDDYKEACSYSKKMAVELQTSISILKDNKQWRVDLPLVEEIDDEEDINPYQKRCLNCSSYRYICSDVVDYVDEDGEPQEYTREPDIFCTCGFGQIGKFYCISIGKNTFVKAKELVSKFKLDKYTNWRLPNRDEFFLSLSSSLDENTYWTASGRGYSRVHKDIDLPADYECYTLGIHKI